MQRLTQETDPIDALLAHSLRVGLGAVVSFFLFILISFIVYLRLDAGLFSLLPMLFAGFLWIGATSLYRHTYVSLKNSMGNKTGVIEFLSTQLVFCLLPYHYVRLRKEVALFKQRQAGDGSPRGATRR
ncbi:MAG: hypothetical protein EPN25_01610 [Nitrospirae bacterium]|nr:MAG: hypothetical protein EPN25_01610 [Nitrospirota bacterium]